MPRHQQDKRFWLLIAFAIAFINLATAPFLLGGSRAPFEAGFCLSLWFGFGALLFYLRSRKTPYIETPFGLPIAITIGLAALSLVPWPRI